MEPRNYLTGAAANPPAKPAAPSTGYPTAAVPGINEATVPGPYYFYKVGEELRAIITAAEIVPSDDSLNQLLSSIRKLAMPIYTSVPTAQAEDLIYVHPRGVMQWNTTHSLYRSIECGQLVLHTAATAKPGTIELNGALVSKTAYAGLWSQAQDDGLTVAVGNWVAETWQFEDYDANQFRVPDMRATFFRTWDNGRGIDPGRTFGSFQLGSLVIADKSATLGIQGLHSNSTSTDNAASLAFDGINPSDYSSQIIEAGVSTGGSSSLGVNAVVGAARPRNVALLACIKY